MRVASTDTFTYLYVNGLRVERAFRLADNLEIRPAHCAASVEDIEAAAETEVEARIGALLLPRVASQLHITADNPTALVTLAWNAQWDVLLLGAFADCEAACNFQCDCPAEEFTNASRMEVTNYYLRGFVQVPRIVTEEELQWHERYFATARGLLDNELFQSALHSLATYRWHATPRVRLAILWSGIESLFRIDSEITFRVSLYASRFLHPADAEERRKTFALVKRLYKQRSAAVHGSKVKGDAAEAVAESGNLLRRLLRQCVESGGVPDVDTLAP